ncbi:MAG: phasin family protein [Planctomycetes bacterium]|nr:phasin family protein [Planctomycetota bacterium]
MTTKQAEVMDQVKRGARKALRVGLGAAEVAREEALKFRGEAAKWADKMAVRGESLEKQYGKHLGTLVEKGRKNAGKTAQEVGGRVKHAVEAQVERFLSRFNVPTKKDVHSLGEKVDALAVKVDRLLARAGGPRRKG